MNQAEDIFALIEAPEGGFGKADVTVSPLPEGVKTELQFPFNAFNEKIESGMGNEYDSYVMKHANTTCYLKAESRADEVIAFTAKVTDANPAIVGSYGIYAEEDSSISVMQRVSSDESARGFSAELTRIYAKKGSVVRLYQIQELGRSCRSWNAVAVYAEEGARVEVVRAIMGGKTAALGVKSFLSGRESSFALDTAYFGDENQAFDFNDVAEHWGKSSASDLYTAGVLAGESSKVLRATIDFKRGATGAAGHELEEVLMLGKKVKNKTVPLILCGEEQVEGQHAATVGRLDENHIYYLCSRGLTPSQARLLMVQGRFAPVIDRIPDEDLRESLNRQIERRLILNEQT